MDIDQAFAAVRSTFPSTAIFQGIHFKYAIALDESNQPKGVLIEQKRGDRYFYWLLVGKKFVLVHAAQKSKLAPMRTIGQSFKPSYNAQSFSSAVGPATAGGSTASPPVRDVPTGTPPPKPGASEEAAKRKE